MVAVVDVIESKRDEPAGRAFVPHIAKLRIVERFKGPRQQEVSLPFAFYEAETVFLEGGKRYLLYAFQRTDGPWTTSCLRTRLDVFAAPPLIVVGADYQAAADRQRKKDLAEYARELRQLRGCARK
jgi:hypothetical protein